MENGLVRMAPSIYSIEIMNHFLQRKNGEITSCDRTARIPWKEQEWFFHDGEAPWDTSKQAPLKKINLVLIEWGQTPISKKRE
jgi:hypothetical protein